MAVGGHLELYVVNFLRPAIARPDSLELSCFLAFSLSHFRSLLVRLSCSPARASLWYSFRSPGLYRERIIFLSKPVDEELGNQLVATMLYLDSEDQKPLNIYINCSGGQVVPCLAIHDTMRHIRSPVGTVGFGGCSGMAGFLLAVGERGRRNVLQNTHIMIHHPSGVARGQASDMNREAQELLRIRDYMDMILASSTGQPYDKVAYDFSRNKYFDAQEALEYGIVDNIVKPARAMAQL